MKHFKKNREMCVSGNVLNLLKAGSIIPILFLSACATDPAEPRIVIQEVKVPVAVSCVSKDFKDRPETPDTDEALQAAPVDQFIQLLLAGRTVRDGWIPAAQKQIDICREAGG